MQVPSLKIVIRISSSSDAGFALLLECGITATLDGTDIMSLAGLNYFIVISGLLCEGLLRRTAVSIIVHK
jgi:hypothetical protein